MMTSADAAEAAINAAAHASMLEELTAAQRARYEWILAQRAAAPAGYVNCAVCGWMHPDQEESCSGRFAS